MAGSFPTSVTSYTNPGPSDIIGVDVGTRTLDAFIADHSDDLEAVMTKLGTGSSTAAANQLLRGTGTGTSAFGALQAGDISTGLITSAMIFDGTIATGDLAANAITQVVHVLGSATTGSTSSASPVDMTDMSLSITFTGGPALYLFCGSLVLSAAAAVGVVDIVVAGAAIARREVQQPTAGYPQLWTLAFASTPSAGSTTVKMQWWIGSGGGTIGVYGNERSLHVIELKR